MHRSFKLLVIGLVVFVAVPAWAEGVLREKNISLSLANEAVSTAVQFCNGKGWKVSATVVDREGVVKAMQRADGAGPHTVDASRRKAYTAASTRNATSAMVETVQKFPAAAHLSDIDGFLILGGGRPIRVGDEVIGAIGVGGAPGGHLDDQCAQAAIDKISEQLK